MKRIPISQDKEVLVDDCDFDWLSRFSWHAVWIEYEPTGVGYWYASALIDNRTVYMHRLILNAPKGSRVDHKNHGTLDNRRENLRLATHGQNVFNCRLSNRNKSGLKGVRWREDRNTWTAAIRHNQKLHHLGCFDDKIQAARAYDASAIERFGQFAMTNSQLGLI